MRSVLVVDDDENVRMVLTSQLRDAGFAVSAVASGEEAVAVSADFAPHVIVLDLYMTGLDGVEVCRQIKGRRDAPYVAIVMLSASSVASDVVAGLEAGADDFLIKPTSMTELRVRVSNLATVAEYHRLVRQERDAALRRVNELGEQLLRAERLASIGTLTAGVCHELANIGQVLGCSVEELEEAGLVGETAEALASVGLATRHVHELTRSLLRVVRTDESAPTAVSFAAVAEEVSTMLRLTGRTKFVQVTLTCERPTMVLANRVQIQQVLLNLIGNAADALHDTPNPHIEVSTRERETHLEVEVKDNGPGMSPEVAAKVFDAFFTTKPVGRGTGLGLSVVKRIVEGWGSELELSTEVGRGAAFKFGLPRA